MQYLRSFCIFVSAPRKLYFSSKYRTATVLVVMVVVMKILEFAIVLRVVVLMVVLVGWWC